MYHSGEEKHHEKEKNSEEGTDEEIEQFDEDIGSPHSRKKDEDEAQNIEEIEPQSPRDSRDKSKEGSPQKDMQDDSQSIHEETQNSGKDDEGSSKGKEQIEHVLVASPRQGAMLSSPKVTKP